MANQITHIVLSKRLSDELFGIVDQPAFLLGTVFPDIRYLNVIERENTHYKNLSLSDVLTEKNSFIAGMKYHSLVDDVREKYMVDNDVYTLIPSSRYITQALKTYEDELLYSKVSGWDSIVAYLNTVAPEELQLVEQIEKLRVWHSLMQEYFKESPTDSSRKNFILGVGFSEDVAREINELVGQMRQIPEIREIILNLYEKWDLLISAE